MNDVDPILAVIPARGGSKGLPGKNILSLAGLPLIAHSIKLARLCPEIARVVVSTDAPAIAEVARRYQADVPFLRPAELAADDTPMWPVIRHAVTTLERFDGQRYGSVLLLDPTSPGRLPEDIAAAVAGLASSPASDGIIGVSEPEFNPIWNCVIERDGHLAMLIGGGDRYQRRQDVPTVYRINATLYCWRRRFLDEQPGNWKNGKLLLHVVPERRAVHIDTRDDFERTEAMLQSGLIRLPWLEAA